MKRWLYLVAGLAVAFVAVSSVVQAVAAGKLGTSHLGGLAPGGRRCDLARHVSPLPAPPQRARPVRADGSGEKR